ncbi:MAG TPA: class E sortase [Rubrobacteraceae bacterium]|nr:class E sortase [Rubrobacteraceae bacterium]
MKLRIKRLLVWVLGLTLLTVVVGLIGLRLLWQPSEGSATNSGDPAGFNVPEVEVALEQESEAAEGPEDKTLKVTIPALARVDNATVPDADGDDEEALGDHAAIHLKGTGFPWQEEANVYLAGHRLGYPVTDSFLAFWDLNNLRSGDEIYVEDADGEEYTYRVFHSFVVDPTDISITETVPGRNVMTLQTCTLPDYSQRLIVQGELVEEA